MLCLLIDLDPPFSEQSEREREMRGKITAINYPNVVNW